MPRAGHQVDLLGRRLEHPGGRSGAVRRELVPGPPALADHVPRRRQAADLELERHQLLAEGRHPVAGARPGTTPSGPMMPGGLREAALVLLAAGRELVVDDAAVAQRHRLRGAFAGNQPPALERHLSARRLRGRVDTQERGPDLLGGALEAPAHALHVGRHPGVEQEAVAPRLVRGEIAGQRDPVDHLDGPRRRVEPSPDVVVGGGAVGHRCRQGRQQHSECELSGSNHVGLPPGIVAPARPGARIWDLGAGFPAPLLSRRSRRRSRTRFRAMLRSRFRSRSRCGRKARNEATRARAPGFTGGSAVERGDGRGSGVSAPVRATLPATIRP